MAHNPRRMKAILKYISEPKQGYPPSVQQIADKFEIAKSTAGHYVERLKGFGLITSVPGTSRTMTVTKKGLEFLDSPSQESGRADS